MKAISVAALALLSTPAMVRAGDAAGPPAAKTPTPREGYADLRCTVSITGTMTNCSVPAENPKGYGFGAAALKMSSIFKVKPRTSDGRSVQGSTWTTRIRFRLDKTPHVELGPSGPTPEPAPAAPSR